MTVTPAMARRIEIWPTDRLVPYAKNARTHSPEQVAQIAASIVEFGFVNPILVDTNAGIIAGHGRLLAARKLGLGECPVVVLDHLSETQRRAYIIADNKLAQNAGWDDATLAAELADLEAEGMDLALVGFSDEELRELMSKDDHPEAAAESGEDEVPEAPVNPVTRPGDVWVIGPHKVVCGDCRDLAVVSRLLNAGQKDARQINVAITSPPYASQRAYDPTSGFRPIPPEEYVAWYADVAGNVAAILAADGSYFLNIKEHADGGERSLYVKDLVLAHKRQWGWRFIDELCWRKTDDGVPGGWGNRFKNAWEPVFHFSREAKIKFHPRAVGHWSDDCFDYSPNNPKSTSGSGLLGTGPRGAAADRGRNQRAWETSHQNLQNTEGRHGGIARPSNVIEIKSESSQGSHSAPFPRALVEFFVKAYSDDGDVIFDPFMGSGTTIAAAAGLGRIGVGCELSPAYCDVIVHRISALTGEPAMLQEAGQMFNDVAHERGVTVEAA